MGDHLGCCKAWRGMALTRGVGRGRATWFIVSFASPEQRKTGMRAPGTF